MIGTWLAFDISGDYVFGHKFCTLSSAETRFVVTAIMALNVRSGTYAQSPGLANLGLDILWCPIDRHTLSKVLQWRRDVGNILTDPEQKETANSLFARVLEAKDEETGRSLSHKELMAEAQVLLVAGKSVALISREPNMTNITSLRDDSHNALGHLLLPLPQPHGLHHPSPRNPTNLPQARRHQIRTPTQFL